MYPETIGLIYAIIWFMVEMENKDFEHQYICTVCGYLGESRTVTKGSFLIEIILWLFFLIPGLIYSIWRLTTRQTACPKCENPSMIPTDTPKGQELISSYSYVNNQKSLQKETIEKYTEETSKKRGVSRRVSGILFILFILVIFGLVIGGLGGLNEGQQKQEQKEEIITKQGKFLNYSYTIIAQREGGKYAATFSPFLPRNDGIVTSAMFEIINQMYGKHNIQNLQPKIVEKDGNNTFLVEGIKVNYFFLPIKEDTGEVHSFIFWSE